MQTGQCGVPAGSPIFRSGQLVGQAGAGDHDGQVTRTARRSGQISCESHRVTGTEPGGSPSRSTATTLTDQLAVPAQDGGRGDEQPEASRSGEESGEGGDQGAVGPASAGAVCVVGARRAGGAGRGSRCPWWCRIGCAARSSPGAWRTSGRSVAAPSADHAGPPAADERAGHGLCAELRAPTSSTSLVEDVRPSSRTSPSTCGRSGRASRSDTAAIMPEHRRPPIIAGQRPWADVLEPHSAPRGAWNRVEV